MEQPKYMAHIDLRKVMCRPPLHLPNGPWYIEPSWERSDYLGSSPDWGRMHNEGCSAFASSEEWDSLFTLGGIFAKSFVAWISAS